MLVVAGPVGDQQHDGGAHPERQARVLAAMEGVESLQLGDAVARVEPIDPPSSDLTRVHDAGYLRQLEQRARSGGGWLDRDSFVAADSWIAARRAAGAGLAVIEALSERKEGVGFVAARPPGHHADRSRGMGFCLLNNVAIAAAWLRARGERVLIVDWDVHHGNGTQAIFWDDPGVLYVSTHQWPLFPGTGRPEEVGGDEALGLTVNVPLPAGATGDVVQRALHEVAAPAVETFAPTWVLVSAGYDAHRSDPLAGLGLEAGDFGLLARDVAAFAPAPGRLALFLEGGYDLDAVRESVACTLGSLVGVVTGQRTTSGGPGLQAVRTVGDRRTRSIERSGGQACGLGGLQVNPSGEDFR